MSCVVPFCHNYFKSEKNSEKSVSFHRFPKNEVRKKWIDAIGRNNWTPKIHDRICSRHFESDCFLITKNIRSLFPNATPSKYLRPLEGSHLNLTGNEKQTNAITTTFPKPLQESCLDFPSSDEDKEDIKYPISLDPLPESRLDFPSSDYEDKEDIKYPLTCQECSSTTRIYQEKIVEKDEEIRSLSSKLEICQEKIVNKDEEIRSLSNKLEELKKMLHKSNKDLERTKNVSKQRQATVWRLRKRNERNSIKINQLNAVIDHICDAKDINEEQLPFLEVSNEIVVRTMTDKSSDEESE